VSVINKVLRDLDQRAARTDPSFADPAANVAVTHGTASVNAVAAPARRGAGRRVPVLVLAAVVLLVGVWWVWSGVGGLARLRADREAPNPRAAPAAQAPAVALADAGAAPAAVFLPGAGAASIVPPPGPVASVPPKGKPAVSAVLPGPAAPLPLAAAPAPASPPALAPSAVLLAAEVPPLVARPLVLAAAVESAASDAARPKQPLVVRPEPAATDIASAPLPWTDAAMEAVGQAQRLWNSGTREHAAQLVRDALGGVERTHAADLLPGGAGAVVGLVMVRELVRMETQLGQHVATLAVLKRHERLWASQADLWAMRGSAAQRLSQHAESGQAYLAALRIRPGEPRWMLGAAVALAAQGQLAQASELAEQARALGGANPEVLAYLRQLGVVVRER
jgi:hypothetical protein